MRDFRFPRGLMGCDIA